MPEAAGFHWIERSATMESYREIENFVLDGARAAQFPEEKLLKLQLIIEEVVVNVIRHAYLGTPGPVRVGYGSGADGWFRVEIRNNGVPFDPLAKELPDLTLDVEKREPGGLGIYLVRQLADEIQYRRDGATNVLSLGLFPS